MPNNDFFDRILVVHTLRIELMDDTVLFYNIDADEKKDLINRLESLTEAYNEHEIKFLMFYIVEDRMVFIRILDIKRIIFLWDPATSAEDREYVDNFEAMYDEGNETRIPDVIIKMRGLPEPLIYDEIDPELDSIGLDDVVLADRSFVSSGFIGLTDDDGEQNFVPLTNISILETKRGLVINDEIWEEFMQNRDLTNMQN